MLNFEPICVLVRSHDFNNLECLLYIYKIWFEYCLFQCSVTVVPQIKFFKDIHHIFTVISFPLFIKGFTLYFNNLDIPSDRNALYQVTQTYRRTMGNRRSKKLTHFNFRFFSLWSKVLSVLHFFYHFSETSDPIST